MSGCSQRYPGWYWVVGAAAAGVLTFVLYWFAPGEYRFYPRCWFYTLTGWQCPGCGGLRAAHLLLHGNIVEAFRQNPLLFVLAGGAGVWGILEAVRRISGRDLVAPFRRTVWVWVLVGGMIAFGILRNVTSGWWVGLTH